MEPYGEQMSLSIMSRSSHLFSSVNATVSSTVSRDLKQIRLLILGRRDVVESFRFHHTLVFLVVHK